MKEKKNRIVFGERTSSFDRKKDVKIRTKERRSKEAFVFLRKQMRNFNLSLQPYKWLKTVALQFQIQL